MAKDWFDFAFKTRVGNALLKELGDRAMLRLCDENLGGRATRRAVVAARVNALRST